MKTSRYLILMCLIILSTMSFLQAQSVSRTPWEMNRGLGWSYLGFTLSFHGENSAYVNAVIPPTTDPNWEPAPNPETIGFSEASILPGNCLSSVDYTYFQTFVTVPLNTTVTTFTIAFSGIDDGGRVTIFNSDYPSGIVVPGSYVYLGGTGTSDLASYIVTGENRVVVTQVDDCPVGNNLQSANVVLNGQTITPPIPTVQTLTLLGGNGNIGDIDPYIDASTDGGVTWGPAYLTGWHPWGFVPGTNSWVNFDPDNTVGINTTTDYRIQFYIPSTFSNPTMTFQLKADNEGIVSINGIQVADVIGQGGGPVPDLTVNQALQTGLNEITVQLIDWGGIVGLNYSVELTMISDQGFELQPAENVSNQTPVANAGLDQSFDCVIGSQSVTLDGSDSSDPDGDVLTYSWSDGISEVSTAASFTTSLGGGSYTFTLTVDDANGGTASDDVVVTVDANSAPSVASGVADFDLSFGNSYLTAMIDLDTVFSDAEGDLLSFSISNSDDNVASAALSGSVLSVSAVDFGETVVTVTAEDSCGASVQDDFAVTVNVVEDLAQTVVFALNKAQLKKEVEVFSGNVLVNDVLVNEDDDDDEDDDAFELKVDKKVTIAGGYALKANRIQVKKDTEIDSDVYFNELDNKGDINGSEFTPLSVPLFTTLPPFKSAPAGSQNITVGKNQSLDLEPGDYGKIEVKDNGKLTFTGGIYNVQKIKLKKKAKLRIESASEVRIEEDLETGKEAYLGPADGSAIDASDIIFYVAGIGSGDDDDENKVKFEKKGKIFASVYAPNSKLEIKNEAEVTGAFWALEVKVDKKADLTLDSFFDLSGTGGNSKRMAWSSEPEFEVIPTDFALDQNYPNPFNPSTTLAYTLPEDGFVSLKVYDILGREVVTLVNRTQVAGTYQIQFEATGLSAGTYLYVLKMGSFRSVRKMVYLK